jgi:hypothetical protein
MQRTETPSSFELQEKAKRVLQCLASYPFFSVGADSKHIENEKQALAQPLAQALASCHYFAEKPLPCKSQTRESGHGDAGKPFTSHAALRASEREFSGYGEGG